MKKLLIAIILFQLSNNGLCQMNEIIRIKYGIHINIDRDKLENEINGSDVDREFKLEEERLQAEKDKIEEEKFANELREYWNKRVEKENLQIFTYTVSNSSIKYERNQNQRPDEYIRIIPESGEMQHFYRNEKTNEAKLNRFNLNHNPDSSDWVIDYEIEEFKSDRKTILGFDCYKMNVKQTRINGKENWEIINKYELYVTDEINLPARLVIHLWEPVTELCALEIKSINMESPNSFSIQRAIEIKKEIGENEIELPKEYENLLTEENKK